jgi:hypothetical protein
MNAREWRWIFWSTAGVSVGGVVLMLGVRWAWAALAGWLLDHVEAMTAMSLMLACAWMFLMAVVGLHPQRKPEVRGGLSSAERRRLAELQAGVRR